MAAITYIAHARAPLMTTPSPDHTAGTGYSFDVKLKALSESLDQPKNQHISLAGQVETVLMRASKVISITLIWPHSEHEQLMEFLYSIAGGEQFTFDPYGTVASPDDPLQVVSVSGSLNIMPMDITQNPWRSVNLSLRPVP